MNNEELFFKMICDMMFLCSIGGADKRDNILIEKSIAFAARILKLHKYLISNKETIISRQIVRSGTSIGANINEANYGQSKADFVSKLHVALKETAETEYWIRLLAMSEYISKNMSESLLKDCLEIKKILITSINTAKRNMSEAKKEVKPGDH